MCVTMRPNICLVITNPRPHPLHVQLSLFKLHLETYLKFSLLHPFLKYLILFSRIYLCVDLLPILRLLRACEPDPAELLSLRNLLDFFKDQWD